MIALICFVLTVLASPFKSKSRLEAENAVLRHQLIVLRRKVRGRTQPTNNDRWFLVQMYRWFPSILKVVTIVQPEMLVRWHRPGFRRYWRWKSNSRGGRPPIEMELRELIRQMSTENQLWVRRVSTARRPQLSPFEANYVGYLQPSNFRSGPRWTGSTRSPNAGQRAGLVRN
jgi:hypothetical protein